MIKTIIESDENIVCISKDEYDTMRNIGVFFRQLCAIYQRKLEGAYQYDWDYTKAIDGILGDLVEREDEDE